MKKRVLKRTSKHMTGYITYKKSAVLKRKKMVQRLCNHFTVLHQIMNEYLEWKNLSHRKCNTCEFGFKSRGLRNCTRMNHSFYSCSCCDICRDNCAQSDFP